MNRKFRPRRSSYDKLEDRKLLAADMATTCLAPNSVNDVAHVEQIDVKSAENVRQTQVAMEKSVPQLKIEADPIKVTEVVLGDGSESRSVVDQLTLAFSGIVNPLDRAVTLTQRGSGKQIDLDWTIDNSSGVSILTVSFSGELTESSTGSLVDGNYELRVDGSLLGGSTAGSDFVYGHQETDNFFRFFGDTDGNRNVDIKNLLALRKSYLHSAPEKEFNAQLDVNGDDTVNFRDLLSLRKNYGEELQWI